MLLAIKNLLQHKIYQIVNDGCRSDRFNNVYWAMGLVRGHLAIQGQLDINENVQISKLWKDSGHKGLGE